VQLAFLVLLHHLANLLFGFGRFLGHGATASDPTLGPTYQPSQCRRRPASEVWLQ
jgi:hypothetical protein